MAQRTQLDDERLNQPITALAYPTRLEWAIARFEMRTVRDLVSVPPSKFESERNCGPKTMKATQRAVRSFLGVTWEEAHAIVSAQEQPAPTEPPLPALPESLLSLPVRGALPMALANRCLREGLHTIRDLVGARDILQMRRRMTKRTLARLDAALEALVAQAR